jgi:hypothetical protein
MLWADLLISELIAKIDGNERFLTRYLDSVPD